MSSSKVVSVTITYEDGSSYEGELPTSDTVYRGKHFLENGDTYEGEFFGGKYNGHGTYHVTCYGETYTGYFVDGLKEGRGATQYGGGIRHEGEYKNGLRDGEGLTIVRDGSIYMGMYKDDGQCGHGFIFYGDKDPQERLSYDGERLNGYMHGHGVLHMKDGTIIRGTFVKGVATGPSALVIYPSGGRYVGYLLDDERHGHGRMWEPNRDYFEGEWHNGEYSLGKLVKADGSVYQGGFKNGVYDGWGTLLHKEKGVAYSGQWKNGVYDGWGFRKVGQSVYRGKFAHGNRNGPGEESSRIDFTEGTWKDGRIALNSECPPEKSSQEWKKFVNLRDSGKIPQLIKGFDVDVYLKETGGLRSEWEDEDDEEDD